MINRVIIVGRITKDVELKKTPNGASVVSFTVACNRRSKQEGQPDADFINCIVWNKTADAVNQYCYKGMLIGIEGRIQTRNYDGNDGKRVYVTEIVADSVQFLENKNNTQGQHNNSYEPQNDFMQEDTLNIESGDLPF